jgi:O-antigen/teichoic acid export membrane protein
LYIYYLGFESYSVISFTLIIAGLMAVLDAGLTATLSREFARADKNYEEKQKVYNTLECIYLIAVTFCIGIVFFFSDFIATYLINSKSYTTYQTSIFLKIISFDIGFQLLLRFYMGGLLGLEKQIKANLCQIGWGISRNGIVVFLIMFLPSLKMFFIWQTCSTVLFTLIIKILLEKEFNGIYGFNFSFKIDKKVLYNIWRFAGGMLLIAIVAALNTQMDKLVISKLVSLDSLGYYTLAISLAQGILILINPISTALLPRFTIYYSSKNNYEASSLFSEASLFISLLVFSIMANMIFFGKELIWVWTGKMALAENVFVVLPIVVFAYTILSLQVLPYNIAIANGYTRLNNILGIISLFITLPGYWMATKLYGFIGAASVFCIVQILTTLIYLYFINKKFIKMRLFTDIYMKQILFPLFISLTITYLFSIIPNFTEGSRIATLIWIGVSTFFTLLITTIALLPFGTIKSILKFKIIKKI